MNDLFDKAAKAPRNRANAESASPGRSGADGTRVIAIRGAREHNLKNIDLEIPRDQLVVFTGLSGSGKSSLAFDTIYAEGQRRYVESLSAYARQFLEMMQKPDVDQIDGLSPAISIEQKTTSRNPRSPVGTVTEIYDYMRLLWARVGVPYSPATGLPIESQTVSQMVDRIMALPEGTRLYLLAPVVRGRKGEYRKEIADFLKRGYQRVKIDGGLGVEQRIDADLVIPDKDATLRKGAIAPWAKSSSPYYLQTLTALGKHYRFTLDTKWKELPKKTQEAILYGSGEDAIKFTYDDGMRSYQTTKPFEGVVTNLERRWRETESDWAREEMARYFTDIPCDACKGYRLKPEALCVRVGEKHIGEVAELSVKRAGEWFGELPKRLTPKQNEIAVRVLKEIRERLKFLVDVGLDYLTLARASGTLSGGESQRIRLASQIGSGLTGVLYVLDEPSIGLHQRDNARLLETLRRLRDLGNSVIVVEHDEDAI